MSADNSQPFTDQRSIILLGETGAGKSSFGNFLLNRESFATGSGMLSTTQKVDQQSCQYTEDNLNIQFHVFDLPGQNDPRKLVTTHLNNTYSALKEFAKCMSTLFAIVIDISEPEDLESTVKEILSFLDKISLPDFNITENALLVFSNAHKLGSTREIQDSSVFRVIESCPSLYKLWTIVRYRHVLVDSVCYATDRKYWLEKMREIITFTRPRVRVLLLGPHITTQNDMLQFLRSKKYEMGGVEDLLGYDENELKEVILEFEGISLSFQKSVNLWPIEDVPESDALNQLTSLIQAIIEIHTFTAFCVLVRINIRLKYTFIEGIKALANAISADNPNQFYNRCFFLFTHPNLDNPVEASDLLFSNVLAMKQMRADMGNRVSILNLQSQSATQDILSFLRQTITFSHAMKQKCYGKDYVSNLLSKRFNLSASPPQTTASPPQPTASPPQPTASPPQTTASPPQTTASPPQTTASPPQTTASPPEPTASPPQPTASSASYSSLKSILAFRGSGIIGLAGAAVLLSRGSGTGIAIKVASSLGVKLVMPLIPSAISPASVVASLAVSQVFTLGSDLYSNLLARRNKENLERIDSKSAV